MAKDYEDYRRRNERTQEAVRRRRNADYATRRSAGYYEDEDYSEPVRRARQTGSSKKIRYQRKAQTNYEIGQLNRQPKS